VGADPTNHWGGPADGGAARPQLPLPVLNTEGVPGNGEPVGADADPRTNSARFAAAGRRTEALGLTSGPPEDGLCVLEDRPVNHLPVVLEDALAGSRRGLQQRLCC
jgi:hypothetical protein